MKNLEESSLLGGGSADPSTSSAIDVAVLASFAKYRFNSAFLCFFGNSLSQDTVANLAASTEAIVPMASLCASLEAASLASSATLASSSRALVAARSPCVAPSRRLSHVVAKASSDESSDGKATTRRELMLRSSSAAMLAALFHFSGTRPSFLGVARDPPALALCPASPNCISTSEEINDPGHYVPPWTYNPEEGRGRKNPASQEQAMEELVAVVTSTKPDGFTPTIITRRPDYLYVEYESPLMGYVDDVEFWFPPGKRSLVEYRSASRLGESDLDANRKRIKALRVELQKYGWASVGY
ncbi:unnamed protein product [Closterium sp. Yama58-4]|nr:unnamed protein product [Closterium sp. Yama58-4]